MNSLNSYEAIFTDKFVPLNKRKRVGHFSVGDVIGKGAFGTVRLGSHLMTGNKVAIKVVSKKSILHRDSIKRRFSSETHALKRLDHAHIVKLLTWMETDKNFYLVMEYINGENLKKYLRKKGTLGECECKVITEQITRALQYMHKEGIVHRDIKLDNIVLEKISKKAMIVDLGLSVDLNKVDSSRLCGSLSYMAPELLDQMSFSTAVDVWSLGVCLYYLLVGCHPFTNPSVKNLSNMHFQILQGYNLPRNLTQDCKDLISSMLEMKPEVRITTDDILLHPWFTDREISATEDPERKTKCFQI